MKFIHCSDIHLDSAMETNLSPARARQRNTEICRTFERMIQYAKSNDVTAIMIAGDLFDSSHKRTSTVQFVLHMIETSPEIDFLYLCGNHDHSNTFSNFTLPDNLKLLGEEWSYYRYGDTVIAGIEITQDNCMQMYNSLNLEPYDTNILMLHGQIGSSIGLENIALPLLSGKNIDYLALGHLHSYQAGALDYRGTYCYSGCLEGRGFDECGEKGFVLLETTELGVRHEFVPFAHRLLHDIQTDISDCSKITDILSDIRAKTNRIPSKDMVKITLVGTYPPETRIDLRFLANILDSEFYSVKIKDESHLLMESDSYAGDVSLKSEFIRTVVQDTTLSESETAEILRLGLAALHGEELNL